MFGLLAGLGCGWFTRPEDLLSERADASSSSSSLPALWMAPHWETIARQSSPEEQYHYAQLRASRADQEAAWIAVPGFFPASRAWVSQAYIQLARVLFAATTPSGSGSSPPRSVAGTQPRSTRRSW